ncbi:MAG: carbohydrate ABC transporter permease [Firmicutes bacterium]|nr:carbohydrate ABC transporter permease [Bacillota bacterium]
MNLTKGERLFSIFNYIFIGFLSFFAIYPFLYVLACSVSDTISVASGNVYLFPKSFRLDAYKMVLQQKEIWVSYGNTVIYTVFGTMYSLFLTICGAYPLSKERLRGKKIFSFLLLITMWFQAGIIPTYLNLKSLNLLNQRLGVIIGFGCTAFYVIIMKTYFESLPISMEESAKIDGANDLSILWNIILPLAKPSIATITLYYAVNRWNSFFWAMILLRDNSKIPLQVMLRKLIIETQAGGVSESAVNITNLGYSAETVIYATIVVAAVPIIALYPFIQKYFVKGIMVGAIKG